LIWRFGVGPAAAVAALFGCIMMVLAAIDLEHFLLPDKITFPGILLGLILQPWIPGTSWVGAIVGVLIGAGILILLINGWYWLRGVEGMGLGDVNMLALIGAFLGWKGVVITLSLASITGTMIGLPLLLAGRLGFQSKLPFGVFLAIGAMITLFAKGPIIAWYSRLFY
jgi:leader peptidase (prepilin peptidase)/N-methyltransferase